MHPEQIRKINEIENGHSKSFSDRNFYKENNEQEIFGVGLAFSTYFLFKGKYKYDLMRCVTCYIGSSKFYYEVGRAIDNASGFKIKGNWKDQTPFVKYQCEDSSSGHIADNLGLDGDFEFTCKYSGILKIFQAEKEPLEREPSRPVTPLNEKMDQFISKINAQTSQRGFLGMTTPGSQR